MQNRENTSTDNVRAEAENLIRLIKELPEERKAYISGYAAGMIDERKLSAGNKTTTPA